MNSLSNLCKTDHPRKVLITNFLFHFFFCFISSFFLDTSIWWAKTKECTFLFLYSSSILFSTFKKLIEIEKQDACVSTLTHPSQKSLGWTRSPEFSSLEQSKRTMDSNNPLLEPSKSFPTFQPWKSMTNPKNQVTNIREQKGEPKSLPLHH